MTRILIADDESEICQMIQSYAALDGYEIIGVSDGAEAVELCRKQDFDLMILDIMMPDMDGYTACRKIREFKDIPVLMLSARGEEYGRLSGFETGIDDCITKPFSPNELIARVHVIISRHHSGFSEKNCILRFGGLELNLLGHDLYIDGIRTAFTTKEYALLAYLAENKGIILSRENILSTIWGYQ